EVEDDLVAAFDARLELAKHSFELMVVEIFLLNDLKTQRAERRRDGAGVRAGILEGRDAPISVVADHEREPSGLRDSGEGQERQGAQDRCDARGGAVPRPAAGLRWFARCHAAGTPSARPRCRLTSARSNGDALPLKQHFTNCPYAQIQGHRQAPRAHYTSARATRTSAYANPNRAPAVAHVPPAPSRQGDRSERRKDRACGRFPGLWPVAGRRDTPNPRLVLSTVTKRSLGFGFEV